MNDKHRIEYRNKIDIFILQIRQDKKSNDKEYDRFREWMTNTGLNTGMKLIYLLSGKIKKRKKKWNKSDVWE